jgi:hypothetical protein
MQAFLFRVELDRLTGIQRPFHADLGSRLGLVPLDPFLAAVPGGSSIIAKGSVRGVELFSN